jgi:hypothetical protein
MLVLDARHDEQVRRVEQTRRTGTGGALYEEELVLDGLELDMMRATGIENPEAFRRSVRGY